MSRKIVGPFYVKNEKREYVPAEMCKDCAFFDEEEDICGLLQCVVLEGLNFEDDENDEEE